MLSTSVLAFMAMAASLALTAPVDQGSVDKRQEPGDPDNYGGTYFGKRQEPGDPDNYGGTYFGKRQVAERQEPGDPDNYGGTYFGKH